MTERARNFSGDVNILKKELLELANFIKEDDIRKMSSVKPLWLRVNS